jgi:outer membrane protein OmpA-like peptidoglycan-associated protein
MRKILIPVFILFFTTTSLLSVAAFGQNVLLDGYVFEENNRGYLNEVKVTILDLEGVLIGETKTGLDGHFVFDGVAPNKVYTLLYEKKIFQPFRDTISTANKKAGEKLFLKRELERLPGYLLEVSIAEKRAVYEMPVDAISGARVEVYNVSKNREELVIDSAKSPNFSVQLEQGNQYTMMIRKKGFFVKRMDANVNINGCYLCMDGFGTVNPGVVSNLTSAKNNMVGSLIANIELDPIDTTKNIVFQNIYYAVASADLTPEARKELDKIGNLLRNNPALVVELGSHTDSRGSDDANMKLSKARAESAVAYLTDNDYVETERIKAKGYGESRLVNKCWDGAPCNEAEHIRNRRTELKIIGMNKDPNEGRSLGEIIRAENLQKFLKSGESDKQVGGEAQYVAPQTSAAPQANTNMPKPSPNVTMHDLENGRVPHTAPAAPQIISQEAKPTPPVVNVEIPSTPKQTASRPKPQVDAPNFQATNVILSDIESSFTGYKIELFTSSTTLSANDPDIKMIAYEVMSEIHMDKLKNGQVSYMVGTFLGWGETERFLDKVKTKYPQAQIAEYFKGKRIGQ